MKNKMVIAMLATICWIPLIHAQEVTNQREYGACEIATEVDVFTEEETHEITCFVFRGLLEGKDISFNGGLSSNEEKSSFLIVIGINGNLPAHLTDTSGNVLMRIDQNEPEVITGAEIINGSGIAAINSVDAIKEFLKNVKAGTDRLAIRIGTTTEAMPLSSQTAAAIEDFLNRIQN